MAREFPFTDWLLARPPEVQELARRFPPAADVKAKPGVVLLVPAPGVTGVVTSWFENGMVGVTAPLAKPEVSPATGEKAEEGDMFKAPCESDQLEVVGFSVFGDTTVDHDLIASILDGSRG